MDLAGTGAAPLRSRMTDARVRLRALLVAALLVATSWGAIELLGAPRCEAFGSEETRHLAGLPEPPACVTDRFVPLPEPALPGGGG